MNQDREFAEAEAFDDCIAICAKGENPDGLRWLGPPGSCRDTSFCGSNQICDFIMDNKNLRRDNEDPIYGYCLDCPGTTAEDCQNLALEDKNFPLSDWMGYSDPGWDECIKVCAGGHNPNGLTNPDLGWA